MNSSFSIAIITASVRLDTASVVEIPTKLQFQEPIYDFVEKMYGTILVLLHTQEHEDLSLRISGLANQLL